jgi:competence protein ComEC
LLAGAALALAVPDLPLAVPLTAVAVAAAGALTAWRRSRHRLDVWTAVAFLGGGVALGLDAWGTTWHGGLRAELDTDKAVFLLTGVLRADAVGRSDVVSMVVDVQSICRLTPASSEVCVESPVSDSVALSVYGDLARSVVHEWRAGRRVRMPAELRRPTRYFNPGVPDDERALARRGIGLVGTVKSGALVEVVARGHSLAEACASARVFVRRAINAGVGRWSAASAAIVTAIVIGDRTGLDPDMERRLQEAGTYHVIAISGGNVAILAGIALVVFRVAGMLGPGAMIVASIALVLYWLCVGGGASVARATLTAVGYFVARALDLRASPVNGLALVAALMVAWDPLAVADPGFLLTFGATAAILIVAPATARALRSALGRYSALPAMGPAAGIVAASMAVEVALLPLSACLFGRVTFAGLALNVAAVPLMAVAQMAGLAVLPAFALFPELATVPGWLAHLGASGLIQSTGFLEWAPFVAWRVALPNPAVVFVYYVALAAAWVVWEPATWPESVTRACRRAALGLALGAGCWILFEPWAIVARRGDGRLRVTFVDVGQGDAALVRFPRGSTLLVDAGGLRGRSAFDVGDRVVAPVVRGTGVRRLTALAFTHGDADHAGGGEAIVREFRPHDVWEGVPVPPNPLLQQLKIAAVEAGSTWTNVRDGDLVTIDGVLVAVHHPSLPDWERQDVRNDDSIVLEISWHAASFVLAGDIGREAEALIISRFAPAPLRLVKVPHHGSLTSSSPDFVRALGPRVAVVSVGRGNPFGHPTATVLQRYREAGADVFRTDEDGAVVVETDGFSLDVRTHTGQRRIYRSGVHLQPRRHE